MFSRSKIVLALCIISNAIATRVPGALFQYDFSGSECRIGKFSDSSGYSSDPVLGILVKSNLTECMPYKGIRSSWNASNALLGGVTSTKNLTDLVAAMKGKKGFSLEIWYYSDDFSQNFDYEVMASFASQDFPTWGYLDSTSENNLEFSRKRSGSKQSINDMKIRSSSAGVRNTSMIQSASLFPLGTSGTNISHTIVTVNLETWNTTENEWIWYQNGGYLNENGGGYYNTYSGRLNRIDKSVWNTSYHLELLTDKRARYAMKTGYLPPTMNYGFFRGGIFQIAFYPFVLTPEQVFTNYYHGEPNIDPIVNDFITRIREDGMTGEHKGDIAYYRKEVPIDELNILELPEPYDMECDSQFNFTYRAHYKKPQLILQTLPQNGKIYFVNGTEIVSAPIPIERYILFRPELNFSNDTYMYAYFEFHAVDGFTGRKSLPSRGGIYVLSEQDPPKAFPLTALVYDKTLTPFCVAGEDFDVGDRIRSARVISLPKKGKIYMNYGNSKGRELGIGENFGLLSTCVFYLYQGGKRPDKYGFIDEDSFLFLVEDWPGNPSEIEAATLRVVSSFISGGASNADAVVVHTVYEDEETDIKIKVQDKSSESNIFTVEFEKLPIHGKLVDPETSLEIKIGVPLNSKSYPPHSKGITVKYKPDPNYFNYPNITRSGKAISNTGLDSFSFHAIHFIDRTYNISGTTEFIKVINQNDYTRINCNIEQKEFSTHAVNALEVDDNFSILDEERTYISGFEFIDYDLGIDLVKVVVQAEHGFMTVLSHFRSRLDFNSLHFCNREADWKCEGDGINDSRLIFVATLEDALNAVNGMRYQSLTPNVVDTITVFIYDGSGGFDGRSCISDQYFLSTEMKKSKCFVNSCNLEVYVGSFVQQEQEIAASSGGLFSSSWEDGGYTTSTGGLRSKVSIKGLILRKIEADQLTKPSVQLSSHSGTTKYSTSKMPDTVKIVIGIGASLFAVFLYKFVWPRLVGPPNPRLAE